MCVETMWMYWNVYLHEYNMFALSSRENVVCISYSGGMFWRYVQSVFHNAWRLSELLRSSETQSLCFKGKHTWMNN